MLYKVCCPVLMNWFHFIFPSDDISISVAMSIYPPMSFVSGYRTQCTCSIYCWSWFTVFWSVWSTTGHCVHWLRHKHGVHVSSMGFLYLSVDGEIAELLEKEQILFKNCFVKYGFVSAYPLFFISLLMLYRDLKFTKSRVSI